MERVTRAVKDLIFPHGFSSAIGERLSLESAMLDASVDCIKVISADGRLLTMNRAGCAALGVAENSSFGMPWLSLLPPSILAAGEQALEQVQDGRSARFPGMSEKDDGITYWDNLLTPVADVSGQVRIILCVSRDITAKTLLEQKLNEALEREQLLAQETRHRIKNLFSVVSGLISMSENEAAQSSDISRIFRDKLSSFSRVTDAIFDQSSIATVDHDRIDIGLIVRSVLVPYKNKYRAEGPPCAIPQGSLTVLILFLHELATNAIKYGAFSPAGGSVQIAWSEHDGSISLKWSETCDQPVLQANMVRGFGSEMVERLARSIGGAVTTEWTPNGLNTELSFPGLGKAA